MGRWHRQPAPSVKPSDLTRSPTLRRTAALNSPNAEQPTEEPFLLWAGLGKIVNTVGIVVAGYYAMDWLQRLVGQSG